MNDLKTGELSVGGPLLDKILASLRMHGLKIKVSSRDAPRMRGCKIWWWWWW